MDLMAFVCVMAILMGIVSPGSAAAFCSVIVATGHCVDALNNEAPDPPPEPFVLGPLKPVREGESCGLAVIVLCVLSFDDATDLVRFLIGSIEIVMGFGGLKYETSRFSTSLMTVEHVVMGLMVTGRVRLAVR